jgi:hypothetical protein
MPERFGLSLGALAPPIEEQLPEQKTRPILFSGPMVRAILENRKTQTRRIAKEFDSLKNIDKLLARFPNQEGCPYGKPSDRLWVRETCAILDRQTRQTAIWYRADCDPGPVNEVCTMPDGSRPPDGLRWRPSIHMPRWASRITLEITDVRVERLQEISREDAIAEGIERVGGGGSCHPWRNYLLKPFAHPTSHCSSCQRSYMTLWESINGPGSWAANPWVWVVSFQVIKPTTEEPPSDA